MHLEPAIDVSIIVVSYNTRALTIACLDSILRESRDIRHEVIVVDNGSSDGSAKAIATHPTRARLIELASNIGFARANNLAVGHARGEYVLLLNPDTVVLDRAIERLVAFARANPQAGIWGGRTLFADGRLNPSSCWSRMTPWNLLCRAAGLTSLFPMSGLFNGEAYGGWARDTAREVDIVSGCFFLISRNFWKRLGGFDPLYFIYGEDADLCLRARRLGARPRLAPEAVIIHHGAASERTRAAKMVKLLTAKASLIKRHWRPALQPLGLGLLAAWPLTRWIGLDLAARLTGSRRHGEAAATWREIWSARGHWRGGYMAQAAAVPFRVVVGNGP
jgi:GT2 family glycosyltransferase